MRIGDLAGETVTALTLAQMSEMTTPELEAALAKLPPLQRLAETPDNLAAAGALSPAVHRYLTASTADVLAAGALNPEERRAHLPAAPRPVAKAAAPTMSEELLTASTIAGMPPSEARETLEELEAVIDDALAAEVPTFMAIGDALIKMRYLLKGRFLKFVKARFGFGRSTACDYCNAADVGRALHAEGKPAPKSVRAALAMIPVKPRKQKAKPEEVPTNATPVPEDPTKPTPTMLQNMFDLFADMDVVILESMTPGRWQLTFNELTTDEMRVLAQLRNFSK